jgi:hypothetical protein
MDKVIPKSNENYFKVNASIDKTNNVSRLTLHLDLLVELVQPIVVQLKLKHFEKGVYIKSFMNVEIEACNFLKTTSSNPLAMNIYEHVRKFGKIPTRCPIKKVAVFF